MTPRPLLWLSALGAALGAVAVVPSPVGAQDDGWTITIETDDVAETHEVHVAGDIESALWLIDAERATVTVEPGSVLPAACDAEPMAHTVGVEDGRYEATISVRCNGPYEIQVVAHDDDLGTSSESRTRQIGVEAKPSAPEKPRREVTATGIHVSWDASSHPDAVGWVLLTAGGSLAFSVDELETNLGTDLRRSTLALQAVHWGAEGPNGPTTTSDPSIFLSALEDDDATDPPEATESTDPPSTDGTTATDPSDTSSTSTSNPPGSSTGSDESLPDGYSEELPFGTVDGSFVPGSRPSEAQDDAEQAASSSPAGLVRTTEKREPGLVAPFALAVMMLTVAAHIAWYLRRSRTPGGGQVTPL